MKTPVKIHRFYSLKHKEKNQPEHKLCLIGDDEQVISLMKAFDPEYKLNYAYKPKLTLK